MGTRVTRAMTRDTWPGRSWWRAGSCLERASSRGRSSQLSSTTSSTTTPGSRLAFVSNFFVCWRINYLFKYLSLIKYSLDDKALTWYTVIMLHVKRLTRYDKVQTLFLKQISPFLKSLDTGLKFNGTKFLGFSRLNSFELVIIRNCLTLLCCINQLETHFCHLT